MKQKLFIFIFLILMATVLIGLNAATYTQKQKEPDSEFSPNRSTYNAGVTGTQAFYSLLAESGRNVTRWQEPPAGLFTRQTGVPAVFVVIGSLRKEFTPPETEDLLRWVSGGGRLVLIDRGPPEGLTATTANWSLSVAPPDSADLYGADPADQQQMTADTAAARAVQPTVLTQSVNAVQASRYAAAISFSRFAEQDRETDGQDETDGRVPPPRPSNPINPVETSSDTAPIAHFALRDKNLVVEAPYGDGRILILSDPYVVSNGGISLVDNAQLAINLVAAGEGSVAFDEYHQGYGVNSNRFLQFFEGTPVVAIFLQTLVFVGLLFFSQSRRFGRPVPEPQPDRLSKLEYVAAMAELQSRTKAFDLAIENIYKDFRRRVAGYFGFDNFTAKSADVAALITERTGLDRVGIAETLFTCEEIVRGERTNKKEVVRLARTLREIEQKLGITRAARTRI